MTGLQSILVPVPSLQPTDSRSLVFVSTLNGKNESEDKQVVLKRTCVTGVKVLPFTSTILAIGV
jgi:hypothetical protein